MMDKQLTFGVLIAHLNSSYHTTLFAGIKKYALEHDINLMVFICQSLIKDSDDKVSYTILKQFINHRNIDGLIICTGSLIEKPHICIYNDKITRLPAVEIAHSSKEIPGIIINNKLGIHQAMKHLIIDHGYKKIAFIRGPENNNEAEERYQAYREALDFHNIPFNKDFISTPGTFTMRNGRRAIRDFLQKGKPQFNAIMGADDEVAIGAVSELQKNGYNVPRDFAVIGFDDDYKSSCITPPLTTIKQPVFDQAYMSIQLLHTMIQTDTPGDDIILPAQLIIRQSCGCSPFHHSKEIMDTKKKDKTPVQLIELFNSQKIHVETKIMDIHQTENIQDRIIMPLIHDFLDDFLQFFQQKKSQSSILNHFNTMLLKYKELNTNMLVWQRVIIILKEYSTAIFTSTEAAIRIDELFQKLTIILNQYVLEYQAQNISFNKIRLFNLREINQLIMTTFDLQKLFEILIEKFPLIGITNFYLVLYESVINLIDKQNTNEYAHIVFASNEEGIINLDNHQKRFVTKDILPYSLLNKINKNVLFFLPVYFQSEKFGYIIFEKLKEIKNFVEEITQLLSSAIKGALLIEGQKQIEQKLKKINNDLLVKTHLLNKKNEKLKKFNVELEKKNIFKSKYLANMSHELRTPINSIIGNTDYIFFSRDIKNNDLYELNDKMLDYFSRYNDFLDFTDLIDFCRYMKDNFLENDVRLEYLYHQKIVEYFEQGKARLPQSASPSPLIRELDAIIQEIKIVIDEECAVQDNNFSELRIRSKYLLNLINVLLHYSKIESGKIDIIKKEIPTEQYMHELFEALAKIYDEQKKPNINVTYTIGSPIPDTVIIDKDKITEAVAHIFKNALTFTLQGEVSINAIYDDNTIIFTITDTGVGIKKEYLKFLFTEFGRIRDHEELEGFGFGLVIAKKLIELHNGLITFDSTYKKGSEVVLRIPVEL